MATLISPLKSLGHRSGRALTAATAQPASLKVAGRKGKRRRPLHCDREAS